MAKNSENARNKSTNTTGSNMTGSNRAKNGFEENSTKNKSQDKTEDEAGSDCKDVNRQEAVSHIGTMKRIG